MNTYSLFSDGGARGNPGPSGIGAVLYDSNGVVVFEISEYIGEATNNQAEYKAFIAGLEEAVSRFSVSDNIICHLDSELIVKQINGEYKVKNAELKILFSSAKQLLLKFDNYKVLHVPRAKNKEADALVNNAIDKYIKNL